MEKRMYCNLSCIFLALAEETRKNEATQLLESDDDEERPIDLLNLEHQQKVRKTNNVIYNLYTCWDYSN